MRWGVALAGLGADDGAPGRSPRPLAARDLLALPRHRLGVRLAVAVARPVMARRYTLTEL